jgi:hypothetical protein|mmetsp:Transcript_14460/g.38405  ORF Transcript_14460/g.38405 Transcript_14460/m.38405 type:complete len:230 (+) Transcript_14460:2031-2720(+)
MQEGVGKGREQLRVKVVAEPDRDERGYGRTPVRRGDDRRSLTHEISVPVGTGGRMGAARRLPVSRDGEEHRVLSRTGRHRWGQSLLKDSEASGEAGGEIGRPFLLEPADRAQERCLAVGRARGPLLHHPRLGRVAHDAHPIAILERRDVHTHRVLRDIEHSETVVDLIAVVGRHRRGFLHREAHIDHEAVRAERRPNGADESLRWSDGGQRETIVLAELDQRSCGRRLR